MFRTPLSLFRTLAILEAISWTLLIAALIARAVNPELALAVTFGGGVHGFIFLSYGATVILVALNNRWRAWPTVVGLVSAVVPYATIPTEIWLHRRGSLAGTWRLEQTDDPRDGAWYDRALRWFLRRPWMLGILIAAAVVVLYVSLLMIGPPGGKG
ncbi:MAG: DUF3817 domain-containing protein [Micrococcales bacterium]|nr:DUF3817 domain-containing protein [Micrococcales bacterium]